MVGTSKAQQGVTTCLSRHACHRKFRCRDHLPAGGQATPTCSCLCPCDTHGTIESRHIHLRLYACRRVRSP